MRPRSIFGSLILVAACGGGGGADDEDPAPTALPPAAGIAITQIELYQGVAVPLMLDGQESSHVAPVVAGRDALMRVHLSPAEGFEPRELVVRVEVKGGAAPQTFEQRGTFAAASNVAELGSTANLSLPGAAVSEGATYSVQLLEATPGAAHDGDSSRSRWPADGEQALGAVRTNEAQRVVIVPIEYTGDGSGRLPDTSPAAIERLRAQMFARYPTPRVEISVGAPLSFGDKLAPTSGAGWQALVSAVIKRRAADAPDKDVYYYGLIAPTASFASFCTGGCISGLTITQSSAQPAELRVSAGLGFGDEGSSETFVHELGHAHGLKHAPCSRFGGISGVDPNYPHDGAKIGVYGYDLETTALKPPTAWVDMMSYCEPTWISDYHFDKLARELQRVASGARVVPPSPAPTTWRLVTVDGDGGTALGESIPAIDLPTGAPVDVTLRAASGAPSRTVTGYAHGWDHADGALVLVPDADDAVSASLSRAP